MPVKFRTSSEYKTHYKPFQSYKSRSFSPTPEQAAPFAGKDSTKIVTSMEPPLQRKKRIIGPATTLSLDGGSVADVVDEYALLGQQEKFAHNVRYRPKKSHFIGSKDVSPAKLQKLDGKENVKEKTSSKPKPPPVVDTEKYTSPPTPLAPRKPKEERSPVVKEALKDKNLDDVLERPKTKVPDKMNEFVQTNMADKIAISGQEAPADYALKYKAKVAPPRPSRKQSEYQREFAWKKSVPSSPLLDAEQVIYNNNMAVTPVKPDPVIKMSEYKRQFQGWPEQEIVRPTRSSEEPKKRRNKVKRSKSMSALTPDKMKAAGSSPVTSPEDKRLLRESQPTPTVAALLSSHGKLKHSASEYRSNFKSPTKFGYDKGAWKGADPPHLFQQEKQEIKEPSEPTPLNNWFAEVLELRRKATEYKKRAQGTHFSREHLVQLLAKQANLWDNESVCTSSTLSALSLESGISPLPQESKTRQIKQSEAIDTTRATIGTEADLEELGEDNRQVVTKKPTKIAKDAAVETKSKIDRSSKQTQVREKSLDIDTTQAAVGTKADLRDLDEDNRHLVAKKSVKTAKDAASEAKRKPKHARKPAVVDTRRTDDTEITAVDEGNRRPPKHSVARKLAWTSEDAKSVQTNEAELGSDRTGEVRDPSEANSKEGRIPTPTLRTQPLPKRRHHLDRTTPAVGGAILTSPPHPPKTFSAFSADSVSDVSEPESQRKQLARTYNLNKLVTSPTLGLPTRDSHDLRDDEASIDKPLLTRYLETPTRDIGLADEALEDADSGSSPKSRPEKKRHAARPPQPTINENFGMTYNQRIPEVIQAPEFHDDDQDSVLSMSVRSIASSCSLASEVYERARNRRDNFWNEKSKTVAAK